MHLNVLRDHSSHSIPCPALRPHQVLVSCLEGKMGSPPGPPLSQALGGWWVMGTRYFLPEPQFEPKNTEICHVSEI